MKQLLKYAKNLEQDFTNPNATYQSKIDLAVTSLVMGDYDKSKQMFDAAIELDSMFPSAWLGKAFVEIAKVDDDHFNSLEIDEYLNRALRSNSDITAYKVALAGCLAYRHAVLIKKYVQAVETAIEEQKKAKQKAMTGLVVAAAGTMFTGGNKSITSNIVGGALIGGGVTTAISAGLKSMELEKLGSSIYKAALGQTYLSIPIVRLCESLASSDIDADLKQNFNTVIHSWKHSVLYLINSQKRDFEDKVIKWQSTMANHPTKEIRAFQATIEMVGLIKLDYSTAIDNYLDLYTSSENKLTKTRHSLFVFSVLGIVLLTYIIVGSLLNQIFPNLSGNIKFFTALILCITVGVYFHKKLQPKQLITLKENFNKIKNNNLSLEDFNLSLI
jgi:tetratricopeptide (TPR) repeat protein